MNSIKTESWVVYLEHFEQFITCNSIPDGQRVSTLLAGMGLKVYRLLHDLLSTAVPGIATYIIITAAMQVHYSPILDDNRTILVSSATLGKWRVGSSSLLL